MKARDFLELLLLAALWGASFLFMRVAAPEFGPAPLMAARVVIATAFLMPLLFFKHGAHGIRMLQQHQHQLFALGVLNSALPFLLFAYAAVSLTAGYSSILNATVPLWGALIAWVWIKDHLSASGIAGLCLGFCGVVVLVVGRSSFAAGGTKLAIAACLLATCYYGISANFTKRYLTGVDSLTLATGSQIAAMITLVPIALVTWPSRMPSSRAWIALFVLGIACTGIAYVLYFRLIRNIGPTGAISVTYVVPTFGMIWGSLFLQEVVTLPMIVGTVVILVGVGLTTGTLKLLRRSVV